MTMLIVFTMISFPFVMLFVWTFELTPDGVNSTKELDQAGAISESSRQKTNYFLV
jgi:hypothetical protein